MLYEIEVKWFVGKSVGYIFMVFMWEYVKIYILLNF